MRVVHLTDLHFNAPLRTSQLLGKRALGAANLVLRGRSRQFGGASRDALVDDVLGQRPDLVVLTGDLTALATEAEFSAARDALTPLLAALPVAMVAGNHDRYTRGSARARRMESHFGPWMEGGRWDAQARNWTVATDDPAPGLARFSVDRIDLWMLDTARPSAVSRGRVAAGHVERLGRELAGSPEERLRILGLHYPLLGPDGRPYRHPTHGLVGVESLIDLLREHPVDLVLHGHVHHWWAGAMAARSGRPIPVLNGGSSGLAPGGDVEPGYLVLDQGDAGQLSVTRRTWEGGEYSDVPVPIPAPTWPA